MSQQPEALKHAEWLERSLTIGAPEAAAELRRLHALKVRHIDLIDGLVAQRDTLRAQVERLQAACRSQTAESDPQAGLSLTGATQEAADTGADELRNALQCLLASGGAIAEATAGELQSAIADPQAAPIVKNQAAAVLRARAALAASTGANVDAGMVPLTAMRKAFVTSESFGPDRRYELVFKFESLVDLQAAHREWAGGIQASGGAE